jgi:hypothetical protein
MPADRHEALKPPKDDTLRCLPLVAIVCVSLLLPSCSAQRGAEIALPAVFDDGAPPPTGLVVLTIEGASATADWDLLTLGALPQIERTQLEPFVAGERTFQGPLLVDVLRASGFDVTDGSITEIDLVALDDFRATLPTDGDSLDGVMLATLDGGVLISLEDGGPIRIIFPDDNDLGDNLDNWVWSLRTGTVR